MSQLPTEGTQEQPAEDGEAAEVAVATWPDLVTTLVEEYRLQPQPAEVNGLPLPLG